ncbi:lamin tail domain-containing protein [Fibrobacterota bacterium]
MKITLAKISCIICFWALSVAQGLRINEFLASNASSDLDPDNYNFVDWIEIHNPGPEAVDVGRYFLSDDVNDLEKWQVPPYTTIPAGGYLVFWADGIDNALHTAFKLSADGEQILLSDRSGIIVDSVSFGTQRTDVSCGRAPGADSLWVFFPKPTEGGPNDTIWTADLRSMALPPSLSPPGGFYQGPVTVTLAGTSPSSAVHYTLDGSAPTETSPVYQDAITLNATSVIRARTFQDGSLPSQVGTGTFFIGEGKTLPVVSLSTSPDYLYDDSIGMYTIGSNGSSGFGVTANHWRDWERPANIEFFGEDGSLFFNQGCGIMINGARRNSCYKSLRVFARGKYGSGEFSCQFFPEKEIYSFSSFILRNGGYPDYMSTLMRDGLIQTLVSRTMDADYQGYRPAVVYLNGAYAGLFNIREKQNEEYLASNHHVDPDNLDILERIINQRVVEGDSLHYHNFMSFLATEDLTLEENYRHIHSQMDVNQYIDYLTMQMYVINLDWPNNNHKYWRPRTATGKWRWLTFDLDCGFGWCKEYDYDFVSFVTSDTMTYFSNSPEATFLTRKLLETPGFRERFMQRFANHLNLTFAPSGVISLIDSLKENIQAEMPGTIARYGEGCDYLQDENKDGCIVPTYAQWEENVEVLRDFAVMRPEYARRHLMEAFNVPGQARLTILSQESGEGTVLLEGIAVPAFPFTGLYFQGLPIRIKAKAAAGYQFMGWKEFPGNQSDSLDLVLEQDVVLTPLFGTSGETLLPSRVSRDLFLHSGNSPYTAAGDVFVDSNVVLQVGPGSVIEMPEGANVIVQGKLEMNGTLDQPVGIRSRRTGTKWGALVFNEPTHRSLLSHVRLENASRGPDHLKYRAAVSGYRTDITMDNVIIQGEEQPVFLQYGDAVIRNCTLRMERSGDLINVKYGRALIERCDLMGNEVEDTDGIDYDGITGGKILNNRIYGFLGPNSDGIDLGEAARDILIQGNIIHDCRDKAISVGQASTAIIERNVIRHCLTGVGVKDSGSCAILDRNTFYSNGISVSCFEKNLGRGGGRTEIRNSLFSLSSISDISVDPHSVMDVSYSLSDTEELPGTGNLRAFPLFLSPLTFNFNLQEASPARDAGDPSSPKDADGTRADLGAFSVRHDFFNIKITEINHKTPEHYDVGQWVEFYNAASQTISLEGWTFRRAGNPSAFTFPAGMEVRPGAYFVLCTNPWRFGHGHPGIHITGALSFSFSSVSDTLSLHDAQGRLIDSVAYFSGAPWPEDTDGIGAPLALMTRLADNSRPEHWRLTSGYGTPGTANRFHQEESPLVINEINYRSFPGFEPEDWVEFHNVSNRELDLTGWYFSDSDSTHVYAFPAGLKVLPGDFVVITSDSTAFGNYFPEVVNRLGDFDFGFKSGGEMIQLFTGQGERIDVVSYDNNYPWPTLNESLGQTLELTNPLLDNSLETHWLASKAHGTPGRKNSAYQELAVQAPKMEIPAFQLYQNYPNPFSNRTIIPFTLGFDDSPKMTLRIFNLQGNLVASRVQEFFTAGENRLPFTNSGLPSGMYYYSLQTGKKQQMGKMVIMKR